jgi:hypothetical protein
VYSFKQRVEHLQEENGDSRENTWFQNGRLFAKGIAFLAITGNALAIPVAPSQAARRGENRKNMQDVQAKP